ncbi:transposase [Prevotella sp. CAG:255]|nr:transposase [Prevotella sp. CAG:255]
METSRVTCRTLETFYHINAHTFEKQYKETLSGYCEWDEPDNADKWLLFPENIGPRLQYKEILSGYREWDELDHADKWLLFPENIGPRLAIDESSLSNDELYTFVANRDRHAHGGSLVAVVAGTKSEAIIQALKQTCLMTNCIRLLPTVTAMPLKEALWR